MDPLELVSLIAVHALERCEAHPHGDGARAFYRAARRVELAAGPPHHTRFLFPAQLQLNFN